jgi:ribosome-associated protein
MIPVDTIEEDERPSKSQKKREMSALQVLGAQLIALPRERLTKIPMPDVLRLAIADAQRFTKHEARRRQLQYVGRLMRDIDPAPIKAALDALAGVSGAESARLHAIERLRTKLMENEAEALADIVARHPRADLQHLRQLRRNAVKEHEQTKPPRAYREIFRVLRELDDGKPEDLLLEHSELADNE